MADVSIFHQRSVLEMFLAQWERATEHESTNTTSSAWLRSAQRSSVLKFDFDSDLLGSEMVSSKI